MSFPNTIMDCIKLLNEKDEEIARLKEALPNKCGYGPSGYCDGCSVDDICPGGKGDDDDLTTCPNCGGPADQGYDRCDPPNPYYCSKCERLNNEDRK